MERSEHAGWKILSGNGLKMLAAVAMFFDHGATVLARVRPIEGYPGFSLEAVRMFGELSMRARADLVIHMIGRIAFPIFCFLLVEGLQHTRDVRKYALRLFIFALLSEIPFDLAMFGQWFYPSYQNVYFTLFFGLLAAAGIRKYIYNEWKCAAVVIACCAAVWFFIPDYDIPGILLICVMYLCRDAFLQMVLGGSLLMMDEITAPLAFIPISMYNGTRGKWNLKYLFYAFYPVHLLFWWAVSRVWM